MRALASWSRRSNRPQSQTRFCMRHTGTLLASQFPVWRLRRTGGGRRPHDMRLHALPGRTWFVGRAAPAMSGTLSWDFRSACFRRRDGVQEHAIEEVCGVAIGHACVGIRQRRARRIICDDGMPGRDVECEPKSTAQALPSCSGRVARRRDRRAQTFCGKPTSAATWVARRGAPQMAASGICIGEENEVM